MNDDQTPPASAIERRQRLLDIMRKDGGTWDWHRARETYLPRPDPRTVRRDLQLLAKAKQIFRAEDGGYQAVG
ncbi:MULTISPECIES: hypothetical protein [unclassified Kitasatospora]|uniref:hypothetical protein n=1 Tax=unclassified Kitasatospora TaxID=2633591 RepID=UPI002E37E85E|nr:hypothetical protein [Kitasatospora sp. NBC_01246]